MDASIFETTNKFLKSLNGFNIGGANSHKENFNNLNERSSIYQKSNTSMSTTQGNTEALVKIRRSLRAKNKFHTQNTMNVDSSSGKKILNMFMKSSRTFETPSYISEMRADVMIEDIDKNKHAIS